MTINASQNIMIDPNEPLILPDRTALTGRIEWFLYSLCLLDYENLPTPMSRIEQFANALVTGEVPNIEPQSRVEEYFLAILTGDVENLPEPESRVEVLLNKLARGEFDLSDVEPIQSRYELLIAYLIKNGGMNDVTYVLHEFLASETHYTMYNTQEKPTKSAILKGQTLVNLLDRNNMSLESLEYTFVDGIFNVTTDRDWGKMKFNPALISNKKYILFIGSSVNNCMIYYRVAGGVATSIGHAVNAPIIFTTPSDQIVSISIEFPTAVTNGTVLYPMLLEYQEGMENWDIPYFEGMQSVKMPVLTSTGKNLADINNSTTNNIDKFYIPCYLVKGNNYTITTNVDYSGRLIRIQTINDEEVQIISDWGADNKQFTFNGETGKYLIQVWKDSLISEYPNIQVQLEQGSTATPYEPYKSNILTVNEEVELGSVGEVKDELNLLTGQLTQRTETRAYQEGDESNSEVITDMANTRYKLPKESIKTVDLLILDQDGTTVEKLNTFKDITHVSCSVDEGSIYPYVEMEVATSNDEDLAAIGLKLEEKNKVQSKLIKVNDYQSDVIDNVMLGITEIYESI